MSFPIFFFLIILFIAIIRIVSAVRESAAKSSSESQKGVPAKLIGLLGASRRNAEWMEAAGSLTLNFQRVDSLTGYPAITGTLLNYDIRIEAYTSDSGVDVTSYRLKFPRELDIGLLISQDNPQVIQQIFSGRKRLPLSPSPYGSGDRFLCSAYEESDFRKFMTANRVEILRAIMEKYPAVTITDEYLLMRRRGVDSDSSVIVETFRYLLRNTLAFYNDSDLEQAESLPSITPDSVVEKTPVSIPAPQKKTVVIPKAPSVPPVITLPKRNRMENATPMPEVSPLKREPVKSPEPIRSTPMPEVAPVVKNVVPAPSAEAAVPPSDTADLTQQDSLSKALFSASFPGNREKDLFESLKGKPVRWTAVLKTSYEVSSDFKFGSKRGIKATFDLCELTGNYSIKTTVKAVVLFPMEFADRLKRKSGESFTFTGTLLTFEPFSKEIYVSEGVLE